MLRLKIKREPSDTSYNETKRIRTTYTENTDSQEDSCPPPLCNSDEETDSSKAPSSSPSMHIPDLNDEVWMVFARNSSKICVKSELEVQQINNIPTEKEEEEKQDEPQEQPPDDQNIKREKYYVRNCFIILDGVLDEYSDFFTEEEQYIIAKFKSLNTSEQRLFIRLLNRTHDWKKISSLSYASDEIEDILSTCKSLSSTGLASCILSITLSTMEEILHLFTRNQLFTLAKLVGVKMYKGIQKDEVETRILSKKSQRTITGENLLLRSVWTVFGGPSIRLSNEAVQLFNRINHLFFLDPHRDQRLLLLIDMQKVSFPSYKCTKNNRVFATREEFLEYEAALLFESEFERNVMESNDTHLLSVMQCVAQYLVNLCDESKDPFK